MDAHAALGVVDAAERREVAVPHGRDRVLVLLQRRAGLLQPGRGRRGGPLRPRVGERGATGQGDEARGEPPDGTGSETPLPRSQTHHCFPPHHDPPLDRRGPLSPGATGGQTHRWSLPPAPGWRVGGLSGCIVWSPTGAAHEENEGHRWLAFLAATPGATASSA